MQAFYGREGNPLPLKGIDTAFYWMRDADTTWLATWSKPSGNYSGYEMNSKNLRWISAERYIDSNQAKTKITAILSPNFTNKNTAVFRSICQPENSSEPAWRLSFTFFQHE
jgi:hypothetical protein